LRPILSPFFFPHLITGMKRDKESDVSASTTPISKKLRLEDEPAAESSSLDKKKAKKARKLKAKEFVSLPQVVA